MVQQPSHRYCYPVGFKFYFFIFFNRFPNAIFTSASLILVLFQEPRIFNIWSYCMVIFAFLYPFFSPSFTIFFDPCRSRILFGSNFFLRKKNKNPGRVIIEGFFSFLPFPSRRTLRLKTRRDPRKRGMASAPRV